MADLLVDIFFLLDILRNFRQSSYSGEGKLVYTPWKIAKGYLQTWSSFWIWPPPFPSTGL